ncbi:MAG: hypothetical protein MUF81_15495 [Verrucomicrobia bacterium]|jgi:hypothetical protein|nr:hypothetical protein [Verrucomicrobiota bacterium]
MPKPAVRGLFCFQPGFAALTIILAAGGLLAWFTCPEKAKDLWLIIGPIISAAIGFIAVKQHGQTTGTDDRSTPKKR